MAESGDSDSGSDDGPQDVRFQVQEVCRKCRGSHLLHKCEDFHTLSPPERREFVLGEGLCLVCYEATHEARDCKMGNIKCKFGCKARHNTAVHVTMTDYKRIGKGRKERQPNPAGTELANLVYDLDQSGAEAAGMFFMSNEVVGPDERRGRTMEIRPNKPDDQDKGERRFERKVREVAVTTLLVTVRNPLTGTTVQAYAMADTGASNTHVSSRLGKQLGLRGSLVPFVVGSHGGRIHEYQVMDCEVEIGALDGSHQRRVRAKCYPNPCRIMEAVDWATLKHEWAHLRRLPLPPPIANRQVEMILGTDCLDAIEAVAPVVVGKVGEPCAKLTPLGWVIGGRTRPLRKEGRVARDPDKLSGTEKGQYGSKWGTCYLSREVAPEEVERTWQIESLQEEQRLANSYAVKRPTLLEKAAVEKFTKGFRLEGGRYKVPLMWKNKERPAPNWEEAVKVYCKQERRMLQDPEVLKNFREAMAKWLRNDWADLIPKGDINGFYIPTFMVVRIDKSTTKYRLIMNGAYEFNGKCINDYLMPGPSRMNKVWDVMVRSRRGLYLIACDVESMFLNIRVEEEDARFLRVIFRDPGTKELRSLQCKTHIFGLNQSPFVAMEVVGRHARALRARYPFGEQAIRRDIIMDDVIHSTDSETKLFQTHEELREVFAKASMRVHKWVTNHAQLWKRFPIDDRAQSFSFASQEDTQMSQPETSDGPTVKALGVLYHAVVDQFQFFSPSAPPQWTMRSLSSFVMQVFDPLELLSPVVQRGRRLVQLLWRLRCKWDETLAR